MDVTFMKENEESFTMELGFFETFLEVKKRIEKSHNIPISKQLLFFNSQLFQDDQIILQTDLTITSTIHLKLKDDQQLSNDSMPNNATASVQPENAPVTALVMPRFSTWSKKLSLNVVPMAIRGKDGFLVKDIESCVKVSELKKFLDGSNMCSNVLPEDRRYFFIHKQSVMYEDRSFEWHGVKDGDTIELLDGQEHEKTVVNTILRLADASDGESGNN